MIGGGCFSTLLVIFCLCATILSGSGMAQNISQPFYSSPDSFTHPGVLVSDGQLNFVKQKLSESAEPWTSSMNQLQGSKFNSLEYHSKPRSNVECGSYSKPNKGCTEKRQDAIAAYTHALSFYFTGDERHANKAIEIMDAWASTLQSHTNSNARLQTGWAGASWPKAGEIIRYYYGTQWDGDKQQRFESMLRNVYLPQLMEGAKSNGNWELVMMEAAIGISVFLEDRDSYDRAMSIFLERVPAYIYLSQDGDLPKTVSKDNLHSKQSIIKFWHGQKKFIDGVTQETCRDFTHTGYGIASIANVAETSRIQGNDLYQTDVGQRIRQALGLHTKYENGERLPKWLCHGFKKRSVNGMTEVGYNAMHHRLGYAMSNTQQYTDSHRPQLGNYLFLAWQTLTHANQDF